MYKEIKMLVGIDLAGDEYNFPIIKGDKVYNAYKLAFENNLNTTIHAGEASSVKEVTNAIKMCNVQRIGHGYKVF